MARPYRSARRQAQSASTRQDVLDAAKALFERHGYGATTMDMIAERANTSTGTIYTSFKTKQAVLKAILDKVSRTLPDSLMAAPTVAGPQGALDQLREIVERMVDLCSSADGALSVAWSAAHTDTEFAEWWDREETRRWHELQPYLAAWSGAGLLRPSLPVVEATDILWSMTGPAVFKSFVADCGWPADHYSAWLSAMLEDVLLCRSPGDEDAISADARLFMRSQAPPSGA